MADGQVIIDTKIDESGFVDGLKSLSSMASGAIAGLTTILAGATTALSAMGAAAIKLGSDFESQMSRVLAISGATEMEFEALVDLAKQLGADTAFSASEAAAGMENLASAGFTASQIIAAMPGLLDLAAVSGGDVAAAAEVAASALNAFGLSADKASHVANVFAKAAADTNAECLDMGEAMKYVAPVAAAMGISLEETAAAIGLMSDAGIKGSQAGTALRGALSRIAKPTQIMQETMDRLGISFYDAEGNMISLKDQVAVLQDAFAGLTQEERNQALVTLYGQESLTGMLALIKAGPEDIDALTTSLTNSAGAAEEMARVFQDNLQGDIENLTGSLETLGLTFSESINGRLRQLVQDADGYVEQLQAAFDAGGLSGFAKELGHTLADVAAYIADSAPAMIDAASDLLSSFCEGLILNAPSILEAGLGIGTSLLEALLSLGADLMSVGYTLIDQLVSGISSNLPSLVSQGLDALMKFATQIYDNAPLVIEAGFDMISSLVQGVLDSLPALISQGPAIISKFANVINDNFPTILKKGAELLIQIVKGIISAIPVLISNIPQIFSAFVDVWSAFNWLSLGKNAITWLKDGILKMVGLVKNAGKSVAETVVNAIIHLPQTLSTLGQNAISFLGSGISGMRSAIVSAAKGIFSAVVSTVQSLPSQLIGIGKNLVEGLWNGITNKTDWIISKIKSFGGAVLKGIKDFFGIKSPSTVMRDIIGANLAFGVAEGVSRNAEAAVGAMEDMAEDISDVEFDAPRIPVDDIDYDAIVAKVGGTVRVQRSTTSEKVTAGPTNSIYRSGNDTIDIPEKSSRGSSNPEYNEVNIYIDGKKTARVLTPYISARQAWDTK